MRCQIKAINKTMAINTNAIINMSFFIRLLVPNTIGKGPMSITPPISPFPVSFLRKMMFMAKIMIPTSIKVKPAK